MRDAIEALLVIGELPELQRLREEFAPRQATLPEVSVEIPSARSYDALLGEEPRL